MNVAGAPDALRHGGGTCTLDLTSYPDSIEVAVHDRSRQAPHMRVPDWYGCTGGFAGPWPTASPAPPRSTRLASCT
ncbi:hypothetical protein ACWGH2_05440 [Streptomyces sp. NPDC054871]